MLPKKASIKYALISLLKSYGSTTYDIIELKSTEFKSP